ncbi:MAG: ABC transporter substrate-binding protein [Planctomycetota bacterium]|jgi:ABC-type branched-subunit amino acid transport system substrate-binding protein
MTRYVFLLILFLSSLAVGTPPPHKVARDFPSKYAGPGREDPEPHDLQEVLIAYYGPADPDDPDTADIWRAANIAVDEANQAGGYRGLPYRLVPVWGNSPWGTGVAQLSRLVYTEHVWAILGSVDGASTHLAEQVVAKARLPLVSPVSSDHTLNLAGVPWMFSCLPGDDRHALLLADALQQAGGSAPMALLTATDHDSRVTAAELLAALGRRGVSPGLHRAFEPGMTDWPLLLDGLDGSTSSIVIFAGPRDSARLLRYLRGAGIGSRYFGGPSFGRRIFLEEAGQAADGVIFPWLCDPPASSRRFAETFRTADDTCPDCFAIAAYDAARMLIAAIDDAGLNRARIRDALEELSPWRGEAGPIEWDPLGQNQRPAHLATARDGHIELLDAEAAGGPIR